MTLTRTNGRFVWKVRLHWFQGELANWMQTWMVELDGGCGWAIHQLEAVTCGEPQRLALGSLLFIIYINNLVGNVKFADDSKINGVVDSEGYLR